MVGVRKVEMEKLTDENKQAGVKDVEMVKMTDGLNAVSIKCRSSRQKKGNRPQIAAQSIQITFILPTHGYIHWLARLVA